MSTQEPQSPPKETWSDAEVLEIAKRQRRVIFAILLALVAAGLSIYMRLASLVASLFVAIMVYDLARILRSSRAGVYALCSLFPIINLFILLVVSSSATSVLREHGVRVGLLGARKDDLSRFRTTA